MKTLIVFREGHSGRFLQAVIQNIPASVVGYRINESIVSSYSVNGTHDVDLPSQQGEYDLVLRILPKNNIYNAIYNIFTKKLLLEEYPKFNLAEWQEDLTFWYDRCFYQIKQYYTVILNDISDNVYPNLINFDCLTDEDYVASVMQQYYNVSLTNNQRELIQNYSKLQLPAVLANDTQTSMKEIIGAITDQMLSDNPWFSAYCIFKFENNNKLLESQRLWSINDIHKPLTHKKLIEIATQY